MSDLCRLCGEAQEDFWHLATECPVTREECDNLIFSSGGPDDGQWNVRQIQALMEVPRVARIMEGWEWEVTP